MQLLKFICPSCKQRYSGHARDVGTTVKCRKCSRYFTAVPEFVATNSQPAESLQKSTVAVERSATFAQGVAPLYPGPLFTCKFCKVCLPGLLNYCPACGKNINAPEFSWPLFLLGLVSAVFFCWSAIIIFALWCIAAARNWPPERKLWQRREFTWGFCISLVGMLLLAMPAACDGYHRYREKAEGERRRIELQRERGTEPDEANQEPVYPRFR